MAHITPAETYIKKVKREREEEESRRVSRNICPTCSNYNKSCLFRKDTFAIACYWLNKEN